MNRISVIKEIQSAFKNVTLGNGVGIYQAEAYDDYAEEEEIKKARTKDRESWQSWEEIPDEVISKYYSALCFVNPEGMRYLLPAFMIYALKYYETNDFASIDSAIYALDNNAMAIELEHHVFNEKQCEAIAKFLRFMVVEAGENYIDDLSASRAYENHWSKYDKSNA